MEFGKARSWKQLFFVIFFFYSRTLILRIKKIKKTEPLIFLFFLILETLILRIKKIKKTEPLIFLFFLILEIIFEILEARSWKQLFFQFF